MRTPTALRHAVITDCSTTCPDFWQLYLIFCDTLYPRMPFAAFRRYYLAEGFEYIDATFILHKNAVVGFCAAAFYKSTTGGKAFTLARAATGLQAGNRGQALPKWALYFKYIRYKLHHPFARLVLTGYIANPLVYAMICKYTGIVFPKAGTPIPSAVKDLKTTILQSSGLAAKEDPEFVVKIHFQVAMGADIVKRIFESEDVYVKHFLSINPRFQEQFGVMVIIPVNWENILRSSQKFIATFCHREKQRWSSLPALMKGRVPAS